MERKHTKKKDCRIFRRQFPAKVRKNGKIAPGGRVSYIFSFTRTRFGVFDFTMFYSPHATYSIERKKRDDSLLLLFCSLGTVVVVLLYCSNCCCIVVIYTSNAKSSATKCGRTKIDLTVTKPGIEWSGFSVIPPPTPPPVVWSKLLY